MNDDGEMTAELLTKKLQGKILPPRHALAQHELPHKTVFYRQGEPIPAEVVAAQAAAASAGNGLSAPSARHGPEA